MMKTFAFITNPITIKQVKDFWPLTRVIPDHFLKPLFNHVSPYGVWRMRNIHSTQGKEIQGYFITCPLLPEQIHELGESFALTRILAAGYIAEKFAVKILGLGGLTATVADGGYTISKNLWVPVTNGYSFMAWSVFEAVYRQSKFKKKNLEKSVLTVIGANSGLGSLCAKKLSYDVSKIIINDLDKPNLERLKKNILELNPLVEVLIEENIHEASRHSDHVLIADYVMVEDLRKIVEFLKPESALYSIYTNKNIIEKINKRNDISIIEAGLIRIPYPFTSGVHTGLPKMIVSAAMAETMLLTFEEKFISYSLGAEVNLDRPEEIADIAVQHGFEVWIPDIPQL